MGSPLIRPLLLRCAVGALALTGCSTAGPPAGPGSASSTTSTAADLGTVRTIDLQAHRGGAGERSENTLPAFQHAMELGVTTLELDTHITKDRIVVINHDNDVNDEICQDTAPATTGDPEYPYAGKLIKNLTLAQLSTLDCGTTKNPTFPSQQPTAGARIVALSALFDLTKSLGDSTIRFNIEIKIDTDKLDESVPRQEFAQLLQEQITKAGMTKRVTIQSFDWPSLQVMHGIDPSLPLVALSSGIGAGLVAAATRIDGLTAVSPKLGDLTPEIVSEAHAAELKVIPWTVDSEADMTSMLALGVDGVITNYPSILRDLLQRNGFPVPPPT
ncbi:glycerophosphodiester phosphodiesterase family protein [Nakamurella sp. A5-74]|uniref:Glycerophosphodiester phosphodiesterase family protein n=1 Tax=Nakamurella sp. A5-74 TaxID=3158264 RepID=A0AAU8DN97_9ACTN